MAGVETSDLPDLDTLINAAEDRSLAGDSSGESSSDKGGFNPDEYAGVVQFYNEQSKNLQLHYQMHLEHQKQKLAAENEAGLLEALQQSLKNFESDHISDFACLSSSLDNIPDGLEKPSMLKELLLSPFSNNYSREINSPEHADSDINTFGSSSPCQNNDPSSCHNPRTRKKLKPFAELLKHMEATDCEVENAKSVENSSKGNVTRLVNMKRYVRKYGSTAGNNKQSSQPKLTKKAMGRRIILHPIKMPGKDGAQGCKTLTLSLKPSTTAKFTCGKRTAEIPLKGEPQLSTSAGTIIAAIPSKVCKRSISSKAELSVPQKKQCTSFHQCNDHDYCTANRSSKKENNETDATSPSATSSHQSASSQKVLKWQEYLQRLREGVQSAPNSPTSSPKVARGSARQPNNFMVMSLQGSHEPAIVFTDTTAGCNRGKGTVPLPKPLRKKTVKQTFGLQEFDKYINVLQNNLSHPKPPPSNPPASVAATLASISRSVAVSTNSISSKRTPATYSLAAMVQRQQSEMESAHASSREDASKSRSAPNCTSFNVALIDESKVVERSLPSGSSGQLVKVNVPAFSSSACANSKPENKSGSSVVPTPNFTSLPEISTSNASSGPQEQSSNVSAQHKPTFKLVASSKDGAEPKSLILSGVSGKLEEILTIMAKQQAKDGSDNDSCAKTDSSQLDTLQRLISCLGSQTKISATKSKTCDVQNNTSKSNKSSSSFDKEPPQTATLEDSCVNLEAQPCTGSLINERELPVDSSSIDNSGNLVDAGSTVRTEDISSANGSSSFTHCDQSEEGQCANIVKASNSMPGDTCPETKHPARSPEQDLFVKLEKETDSSIVQSCGNQKFSLTRSMAAAEMMASDVIDDGLEKIMVYKKQSEPCEQIDANNNAKFVQKDDDKSAVISLEEAIESLESDEVVKADGSTETNLSVADNLFCKLPSYFLTGKVVSQEKDGDAEPLKKRGLKSVHCDPLISAEQEKLDKVEFNKLPHYLSSGKGSRLSSPNSSGRDKYAGKASCGSGEFAVKLQPVGDNQHLTPQGTPVDTSETYYSKLPSYYTYGRPHPPVKTFNDDVADAKDDTVTTLTLDKDKHRSSKRRKHSKRSHKSKKRKRKSNDGPDESSQKVLYSKLPSYYLSGRMLPAREKENSRYKTPSIHSLSCSSSSSESRSVSPRRSPSRRHPVRGNSRSPSLSSSCSDHEMRRSWKQERKSCRTRRERSYDRRSYDSSDEDNDQYSRRREREARRARKQHLDAKQRDRQRAMEERRVVYVGGIDKRTSKQELRRLFLRFGNIETISLHFRDNGDNYGFLTFQYTCDAFRAIEEGRDLGPGQPKYDLCFGGRRQFCKTAYEDLDSRVEESEFKPEKLDDFDSLLQQARRNLRR